MSSPAYLVVLKKEISAWVARPPLPPPPTSQRESTLAFPPPARTRQVSYCLFNTLTLVYHPLGVSFRQSACANRVVLTRSQKGSSLPRGFRPLRWQPWWLHGRKPETDGELHGDAQRRRRRRSSRIFGATPGTLSDPCWTLWARRVAPSSARRSLRQQRLRRKGAG